MTILLTHTRRLGTAHPLIQEEFLAEKGPCMFNSVGGWRFTAGMEIVFVCFIIIYIIIFMVEI